MSTTQNFFQKALAWIASEFSKAPAIEQSIAKFANNLVNIIKGLQANQTVQFLESGIIAAAEAADPALTPLISGIELALPKIASVIQGGIAEANKSDEQQLNDFVSYLQTVKGINGTVYAGLLATLSASIQAYVTSNNGIVATDAQLIASGQAIHAA